MIKDKFDDKTYVLDDGISTLAYFHKYIRDGKNEKKIHEDDKEFMKIVKKL